MSHRFGIDELSEASREFARLLLDRLPDVRQSCSIESIEGLPGLHLFVRVRSPAGPDRDVVIWMEEGDEPSLGFGEHGWHTHETNTKRVGPNEYRDESLIDLLDAIMLDQFVLFEEPGADPVPFGSVLDLRDPDDLLEELTSPYSGERLCIKTFTGDGDREVTVTDFRD